MSGPSDERSRARDAALRLLAVRARTVEELRRRLGRKDFDAEVVEAVVRRLRERGHLDDRAFSREFVRERLRRRPRGRFALVQELRKRGVDRSLAEAAVEEVFRAEDVEEADVARRAARAWLARQSEPDREALGSGGAAGEGPRRRLYAYLERRGFPRALARRTLDALVRDLEEG